MNFKFKTISTIVCLGVVSSAWMALPAHAEEDISGVYVGTSLGYLKASNLPGRIDGALANQGLTSNSTGGTSSIAPDLKLGYRINPNYSFEAVYNRLGSINEQSVFSAPVASGAIGTWGARGVGLHALLSAPLTPEWTLTGRLGLEQWRTTLNLNSNVGGAIAIANTNKHTSGLYGLGASYTLSENVDLTYDFTHYNNVGDSNTTGQTGVNALSIGMRYHFE